jgi:hypothetical protein
MKRLWQTVAIGIAAVLLIAVAVIVAFSEQPTNTADKRIVTKDGLRIVKDVDQKPIPPGAVTVVRCTSDGRCVTRVK